MIFPPLDIPTRERRPVPTTEECYALWNKYVMLDNIREHSQAVGNLAKILAEAAVNKGYSINVEEALAAGLLHDIAKTYTIRFGGAHDQIGAAWMVEETGNRLIAQAVLFHVRWPWQNGPQSPLSDPVRLPLLISYADKRVRHGTVVTLEERFSDLLVRYGATPAHQASILRNREESMAYEKALFAAIGPVDPS